MPYRNTTGRFRSPTPSEKEKGVDIRSDTDVKKLEDMFKNGAPTFVLIYADWCGHCHRYLPMWSEFENTPGRTANMARVHYDMQEHIPAIKNAKIQGYPSVIKVLPDGRIESYTSDGAETNAVPIMRDEAKMQSDLRAQSGGMRGGAMRGGAGGILAAFVSAVQVAGPTALLLLTNSALSRRSRTFKSPKRASRRASTRRMRR